MFKAFHTGFNFQFENTPQIQIFLLFFTGLILIGYITGYLTAALVRKLSGTIRAGIIPFKKSITSTIIPLDFELVTS